MPSRPTRTRRRDLLALVRDLDELGAVADGHAGRVLLGGDGAGLGLVLDEGDALAAGHEAHLAEALEAAEDGGERVDVVVVGQVLHEQDLVRRQVLVRHDGVGRRAARRLKPGAARRLRRAVRVRGGDGRAGALEPLLLFGCLGRFSFICGAASC